MKKSSEDRQMLSSPVAVYWIETTENWKSESILIFMMSIVYIVHLFESRK